MKHGSHSMPTKQSLVACILMAVCHNNSLRQETNGFSGGIVSPYHKVDNYTKSVSVPLLDKTTLSSLKSSLPQNANELDASIDQSIDLSVCFCI